MAERNIRINIIMAGKLGHTYPHIWKSGPDPVVHQLWLECQRSRAQAKYRGQEWLITEQEYVDLWMKDDRYKSKGRHRDDICMTRKDKTKPWTVSNVVFENRAEHYRKRYKDVPRYERGTEVVK